MPTTTIPTDVTITGSLSVGGTTTIAAGSVNDSKVSPSANIALAKIRWPVVIVENFNGNYDTTPSDKEVHAYVAGAAGTIKSVEAYLRICGTAGDVDFDVKKNGTTVLSAVINIDNADADGTIATGTLSTTTYADGDVFTIEMIDNATTGASGPVVVLTLDEDPH